MTPREIGPADAGDCRHADTTGDAGTYGRVMTADELAVWRTCLHEAAHATACEALGGLSTQVVVFPNGDGFAEMRSFFSAFERAVFAWAGGDGERLAAFFGPGVSSKREPATVPVNDLDRDPELKRELLAAFTDDSTDDYESACKYLFHPKGDAWASARAVRLNYTTRRIIEDNLSTVVNVARELYRRRLLGAARLAYLLADVTEWNPEHFYEWRKTMLDELIAQVESVNVEASAAYAKLVRDLGSGLEREPGTVSAILKAAGKTTGDLRDAVTRLQARFKLFEVLNSAKPGLNAEAEKLKGKIAAADAALQEAHERHAATVEPIHARLQQIHGIQSAANSARSELFRSCRDERRATYDRAADHAAAACSRVAELRRLIDRGAMRNRVDEGPEADRERRMAATAARELPDAERIEREALAARDAAEADCQRP